MQLKKYCCLFIIGVLSFSGLAFAQNHTESSVTLMNIGTQDIRTTYEILGDHSKSSELMLHPKQSHVVFLHQDEKGVYVSAMNGYATSVGGAKAKQACTSFAGGNPVKLIFDSSAHQTSMSCRSDEA